VCRVSGKLPNGGCEHVPVVSRDGYVESRSMVYTEYFARGTQPNDVCPLHPAPSLLDRLAGIFGGDSDAPLPADEIGVSSPVRPTTGSPAPPSPAAFPRPADAKPAVDKPEPEPQPEATAEEPKKKRGFWSRLFGRDGKSGDQEEQKKEEPRPPAARKPGGQPW
jgi:hypothetical protein